jgi:hypothetical protein
MILRLPLPAALATALVIAPLGAKPADLVVWWEEGFYRANSLRSSS